MIANESDVAAVIVEPVVGTNGVLVPPKEYMPRLREICDRHGVLLIADEVMSGWGRTGEWFAMDNWGVKPDILVTAKGITTAYVPLGLCATTGKIAEYFDDHFFAHGHTYEAHPMTLGPAVAAIHEMQRLDLVARSREMGQYLGAKLQVLKPKHPSIGDVRGLGLFWAVAWSETSRPRPPSIPCRTRWTASRPSSSRSQPTCSNGGYPSRPGSATSSSPRRSSSQKKKLIWESPPWISR